MKCQYFNLCGSCTLPLSYEEQLSHKIQNAIKSLDILLTPSIIKSHQTNYRNRAEFRIWHDEKKINYALNKKNLKEKLLVLSCPKTDIHIQTLMPILLEEIKKDSILKTKLFGIEFLSSNHEMLISMLYHKKIDSTWLEIAKKLANKLNIKIIGRSRKVKLVSCEDFVKESLKIKEKTYNFHIQEGSFSQPNRYVNEGMINWVKENLNEEKCIDLLELYCGHGNFTIPLSNHFKNILATEISKSSIKSALKNCELNDVKNIRFLRMSAEELVSAFKKEREFFRLRDLSLDDFNFSHVFVDPPRAGLDDKSLDFIRGFSNIIYISCSLESLKRDLEKLKSTHKAVKIGFFDQFPYTKHLESGVILEKN